MYVCVCICNIRRRSRHNGYLCRKWTRRPIFKPWTILFANHFTLKPLAKVLTHLFSFQLWVNSRASCIL